MNGSERKGMVSIIIPAYNAERWIERSVNSAVRQTYSPTEVIVVENGSTDRTTELLEQMEGVSLYHSEKGVSYARNLGIAKSRGEFLFFLDADDWIEPDAIARMMDAVTAHTGLVSARYFGDRPFEAYERKTYAAGDREYLKKCLENPTKRATVTAVLFRRSRIMEQRLAFQTTLTHAEDSTFLLEYLITEPKIVDLELPIYHSVRNPDSTVRKKNGCKTEAYAKASVAVESLITEYDKSLQNAVRVFQLSQVLIIAVNKICPMGKRWREKIRELKNVCDTEPFRTAIADIRTGGLRISRRLAFMAMKLHWYTAVLLLCEMRTRQNSKRM